MKPEDAESGVAPRSRANRRLGAAGLLLIAAGLAIKIGSVTLW